MNPRRMLTTVSLVGSGFPFSFQIQAEFRRWFIAAGRQCSRLSEGGIQLCLVEELNFNVYYIPLCLEGQLSGRRSCPFPLSTVFPTSQHGVIHFTSLKGCRCHLRYKQPRIWEDAGCQGKMQISFHPFGLLCPPSASPSMPQNSWDPALGRLLEGDVSWLVSCQAVVFALWQGWVTPQVLQGHGQVVKSYSREGQAR